MEANNLSLEQISPKEAEMRQLVAEYGNLTIKGVEDKEGYALVRKARMAIRDKRLEITDIGEKLREATNKFSKDVIAKQKAIIAVGEPLEKSLHEMEKAIDAEIEKEKLRALLPARIERLEQAGLSIVGGVGFNVEHLMEMDPETFNVYFNERMAKKNELDAAALAAEREKIEAAKRAEQEAKDAEAREAQRKADEEARIEAAKKETEERIRREAKEAEEKAAREKKEAEERAAKDQAELESKKKYLNWLKKHDALTPENKLATGFVIQQNGKTLALYKYVETITL